MGGWTDPRYVTYRTDPGYVTYRTDLGYVTYRTDPRYVTYRTDPRYVTYRITVTLISLCIHLKSIGIFNNHELLFTLFMTVHYNTLSAKLLICSDNLYIMIYRYGAYFEASLSLTLCHIQAPSLPWRKRLVF